MPVTGSPTTAPALTVDMIRMSIRDLAGAIPNTGVVNVLLDNVEFSDAEIQNAVAFTLDRYNAMTPVTNLPLANINRFVLLQGVVSFLLSSESYRQARNQATVQDGDVAPIGVDDKASLYAQMSQMADAKFEQYARGLKTQANMEAVYGGLGSGYRGGYRNYGGGGNW